MGIGSILGGVSSLFGIGNSLFGGGGKGGGYGGALASGLGSAAGAYFQYKGAQQAAKRLAPFASAGTNMLPILTGALTGGPEGGPSAQKFMGTPGFQFQLGQGMDAIENSAAARGGVVSGNTLKALQGFGTGLAAQDFNNWVNQLFGVTKLGETAAAGQGYWNAMGQQALGAGAVGGANALAGGLNQYSQNSFLRGLNPGYRYSGGGVGGSNVFAYGSPSGLGMNPAGSGGRGIYGYI